MAAIPFYLQVFTLDSRDEDLQLLTLDLRYKVLQMSMEGLSCVSWF